ncbi:LysR family transcriptional regulator [Bordetella ansorpii]|uniref:LysR family transcriptional regulator n=1 Tax=Bordetella ansorpii TaxID=288768 RepID=A0A157QMD6_9BORD|nr:LysR family transcriptional regulator [Bordetella ansorpii]SAI46199.1 LysR family transcriptional regulator [Bordetella ansorpii]
MQDGPAQSDRREGTNDLNGAPASSPRIYGDPRITLDQLRAFVAIADSGNFHLAAQSLHRSQPAITHKLKQLEQVLGTTLVSRRKGRVMNITESGVRFLMAIRESLQQVDLAVEALRESKLHGQVRVGAPADTIAKVASALAVALTGPYHSLEVPVTAGVSNHLLREFEAHRLDVVLFKSPESASPPVPCRRLSVEPMHWVASHEWRPKASDPVPLVTFYEGCAHRETAIDALVHAGRKWRLSCMAGELGNVRAAVLAGLGVAALAQSEIPPGCQVLDGQGLPALPRMQLSIAMHAHDTLYAQVADLLAQSWRGAAPARQAAPLAAG